MRQDDAVQISAKADYAVRALCMVAAAPSDASVKADEIAAEQGIPRKFLDVILADLRRAGLLNSRRGAEGGYWLAKPAHGITIADVVRITDGPLALVRGQRPEALAYDGAAQQLRAVWVATRAALRDILERTTIADVVSGSLPESVTRHVDDERAWQSVIPTVHDVSTG